MSKINWGRLAIGGLIAAVICFLTDGFLHEKLLHDEWRAAFDALHATPPPHNPMAMGYFFAFELGRGFIALFSYVMMRTRLGASPRTAVWAGVVSWFAFSVTGPIQFIPLGIFSVALWWKAGVYQLVTSMLASVVGAAGWDRPQHEKCGLQRGLRR